MATLPLAESKNAIADANGVATLTLGPLRAFESWQIRHVSVASTSTVLVPTARVYRGAVQPSRLIDGTYDGTLDSSQTELELRSGDRIVIQWTGCDVAAICTGTVEGEVAR